MLEDLTPPVKISACKVRTVLNELNDKDQAILEKAIGDVQSWPAKTLSRELNARGILLLDQTLTKHRQGLCSC